MTWSKVTWKPCTDAEAQKWDFAPETGLWSDRLTGRCMSILDKQQPLAGSNFAPVVLDVCGGSDYSGTPSGQKWSPEPASALTSGAPCDLHSPLPPTNCESAHHVPPPPPSADSTSVRTTRVHQRAQLGSVGARIRVSRL